MDRKRRNTPPDRLPPSRSKRARVDSADCANNLSNSPKAGAGLSLPQGEGQQDRHRSTPDGVDQKVYEDLGKLRSQLRDPEHLLSPDKPLVFDVPPHRQPRVLPSTPTAADVDAFCRLDAMVASNSIFIGYEEHLLRVRRHALDLQDKYASGRIADLALLVYDDVQRYRASLRQILALEWQRQYSLKKETCVIDTSRHFRNKISSIVPSVLILYLTVASLYLLSNVSQDDCRFALCGLSLALQVQMLSSGAKADDSGHILRDVEEIVRQLDISPRFMSFVCCTTCFFIKLVNSDPPTEADDACSNRVRGRPCNTPLFRKRTVWDAKEKEYVEKRIPVREFLYHPIQELISHFYTQPHLEPHLQDDPCLRPRRSMEDTHDIWEAPGLREFQFTSGTRFTDCADEDRLVFGLNMDGFHPETNKQAGKVVSVGALYLVCLNLPPAIRYKMENIHLVGVIPGPHHPSKHEINYLLSPMIDDFLILWETGMYVSRTHLRPEGVRVRAAIVPLICDLPAARQMSGFASYSHNVFCSECKLTLTDIDNLDYQSWPMRTCEENLEHARLWRDAATEGDRRKLYAENGTRWSELLRLPYWDPTKFTLIDSMHAFFLRLLQHHVRSIWGMNIKINDGTGFTYDPYTQELSEVEMRSAHHVARHGSLERLRALKKHAMVFLCQEYGVAVDKQHSRNDVLRLLTQYRVEQKWWTADNKHIPPSGDGPLPEETLSDGKTTAQDMFWNGNKSRLSSLKKVDLLKVFSLYVQPTLQTGVSIAGLQKKDLHEHIHAERLKKGIVSADGTHVAVHANRPRNQTAVNLPNLLGKEALEKIRLDIVNLNLPSWQANGPRWPGEAKFGKLTAAQWKTFCLINLPITLTQIWGVAEEGSTERRILDNFMHLVSAIKLATMDKMNETRILEYEHHMRQYLSTLLDLFPSTTITPYQHLSLHFGRHLRMFGPVHAWRCFAFERYNHIMQSFPTNHKFSDLEKTMFRKFCSAQRIRAVFTRPDRLPRAARSLIDSFDKNYGSKFQADVSPIFFDDGDDEPAISAALDKVAASSLEPDVHAALQQYVSQTDGEASTCPKLVHSVPSIKRQAQVFSTLEESRRRPSNSHVVFLKDPSNDEERSFGAIYDLFIHKRIRNGEEVTQCFAVISPYKELSAADAEHDLFRRWYGVTGRLVLNALDDDRYIVPFSSILCHFASLFQKVPHVTGDCLLALPLDKS